MGLAGIAFFGLKPVGLLLVLSLSHLLVDWFKASLSKNSKSVLFDLGLLWLDQALHIFFIVIMGNLYYLKTRGLFLLSPWTQLQNSLGLDLSQLVSWTLALAIIARPAMIMVREPWPASHLVQKPI